MTKLEQLWDDYPIDPAPTAQILREGRAASGVRRRRLLTRPLMAGGGIAALVGAFVAGTVIASPSGQVAGSRGSGGAHSGPLGSDASPVAFVPGLHAPSSCDALLQSYKDRSLGLVTAWGWGGDPMTPEPVLLGGLGMYDGRTSASRDLMKAPVPQAAADGVKGVTSSATGTNVQEAGVDEPDTVKTDGRLVVRAKGSELAVFDASGTTVAKTAALRLPKLANAQILLSGTTVVAFGTDTVSPNHGDGVSGTRLITVSLADPKAPRITHTVTFSTPGITARQSGEVIRLVMSTGLPDLDFVQPGKGLGRHTALEQNRAAVEHSTVEDWLPTYDAGDGPTQLLDCDAVAVPDDDLPLDTVAIAGFKADDPAKLSTVGIAAAADLTYQSSDRLYLAESAGGFGFNCRACLTDGVFPRRSGPIDDTTSLFAFALDGTAAAHIASGKVDGYLKDRWSMDAVGDSLRLALSPSEATGNATDVVTMAITGDKLVETGRLGDIARGEELQSVRWFDDLALLVTFRQTDPLFAIDLSDPAHPRHISHLKALGYSTYLHPLDSGRILGIGVTGILFRAKATLFDVSDLAKMRQLDVVRFDRGTSAIVNDEPRAFTWLPDHQVALTTLTKADGVWLAVIHVGATTLSATTTKVYEGNHRTEVRTLETTDGRVVLVTDKNVRFVSLPST